MSSTLHPRLGSGMTSGEGQFERGIDFIVITTSVYELLIFQEMSPPVVVRGDHAPRHQHQERGAAGDVPEERGAHLPRQPEGIAPGAAMGAGVAPAGPVLLLTALRWQVIPGKWCMIIGCVYMRMNNVPKDVSVRDPKRDLNYVRSHALQTPSQSRSGSAHCEIIFCSYCAVRARWLTHALMHGFSAHFKNAHTRITFQKSFAFTCPRIRLSRRVTIQNALFFAFQNAFQKPDLKQLCVHKG